MAQAAHPALAGVLSLSAMCRTFLGPHKGAKCIVHEPAAGAKPAAAAERSTLVTSAEQLLHAIDGDPSSTTLLLEFMDAQVRACGGGATWLVVLSGFLAGALADVHAQGCPLSVLLSALDQAIDTCIQAADDCAHPLHQLAQNMDTMPQANGGPECIASIAQTIAPCTTQCSDAPTSSQSAAAQPPPAPAPPRQLHPQPLQQQPPTAVAATAQAAAVRVKTASHDPHPSDDVDWFFDSDNDDAKSEKGSAKSEGDSTSSESGSASPGELADHSTAGQASWQLAGIRQPAAQAEAAGPVTLQGAAGGTSRAASCWGELAGPREAVAASAAAGDGWADIHMGSKGRRHTYGIPAKAHSDDSHAAAARLPPAQRTLLCAVSDALSHGAEDDMHLAMAVLDTALQQLQCDSGSGGSGPAGWERSEPAAAELQRLCRDVRWDAHVTVHELLGPPAAAACVLPGVGLMMQDWSLYTQLNMLLPLTHVVSTLQEPLHTPSPHPASSTQHTATTEASQTRATGSAPHRQGTQGSETHITVALIEGGLGRMVQHTGVPSRDLHTGVSSRDLAQPYDIDMAQPCDIDMASFFDPSPVEQVIHVGSSTQTDSKGGAHSQSDTALDRAAGLVMAHVQPLGVQLVLVSGHVHAQLAERVLQRGGPALVTQVPQRALAGLAGACGVRPAAGLAAVTAGGCGVARVRASVIECGVLQTVAVGANLQAHARMQGPGQGPAHCLLLSPACMPTDVAKGHGAGQQSVPHGAVRAVPAVTVLLTAPVRVLLQQRAEQLQRSFHRALGSLQCGRVLPGAGVFELLCAQALRSHHQPGPDTTTPAAGLHAQDTHVLPAWQRLNKQLAADQPAWQTAVFTRVAHGLEDMVVCLLQNAGCSYSEGLGRLGSTKRTLSDLQARSRTAQDARIHTYDITQLGIADMCMLQRHLISDTECESSSDGVERVRGFVADSWHSRVQAWRAVRALVRHVLLVDRQLYNSNGGTM